MKKRREIAKNPPKQKINQNSFSCPECGAESNEDQKFCKKCGKQLSGNNLSDTPMNQKELKKYTKKRLGGTFGPSKEVKKFFTTGSVFNRQKATTFAIITSDMVKKGIKSGEITTTDEIDQIIQDKYNIKQDLKNKKREEKETLLKKLESEAKYTVVNDPGPQIVTHTKKPIDWSGFKRSTNVIGGAALLGPAGALMGAAISDNKKPEPKTVHKRVHATYTQKESIVEVFDDKLQFSNKKNSYPILFKNIDSMHLFIDQNKFEINKENKTKVSFKGESIRINYTENLFNELESKFKEYKFKNQQTNPVHKSKPEKEVSDIEEDPINQIKKLNKLKEAGIITNDEFEKKKQELLERI